MKLKTRVLLSVLLVSIIIFIVLSVFDVIPLRTIIDKIAKAEHEEEIVYNIYDRNTSPCKVLVKIYGKKEMSKVEFHDGLVVECNNKMTVSRDMELDLFTEYDILIFYKDGELSARKIYVEGSLNETYGFEGREVTYCVQKTGYYKLQAYGGSGGLGYGSANPVGLGGFTEATVHLEKGQILYIHVGTKGIGQSGAAAYNGGGCSGGDTVHRGGQGGGATDFRLISGAWNNSEGLRSRILVAGGGGGAQSTCGGTQTTAGHGGGLTGGYSRNNGSHYSGHIAYGGSQTAGGGFTYGSNSYHNGVQGGFGQGANAGTCAAGGGGGYYGGGSVYTAGGGGGSSFVTGYDGCDTTYRNYHKDKNGNLFVFTDVTLSQGVNNGDGKATIEFIEE